MSEDIGIALATIARLSQENKELKEEIERQKEYWLQLHDALNHTKPKLNKVTVK